MTIETMVDIIKRIQLLALMLLLVLPVSAQQMRMKDAFAAMPDSIFPLLTRNNRLDCIDFIENNMVAQVNNLVDEPIELTALTDNYLDLKTSNVSHAEMKLVKTDDSKLVICVVKTYSGPVLDSSIRFYSQDWKLLENKVDVPAVEAFFKDVPEAEQSRRDEVVAMLRDMPLVAMRLSPDDDELTLALQPGELMKKEREWVQPYLKELKVSLTELLK